MRSAATCSVRHLLSTRAFHRAPRDLRTRGLVARFGGPPSTHDRTEKRRLRPTPSMSPICRGRAESLLAPFASVSGSRGQDCLPCVQQGFSSLPTPLPFWLPFVHDSATSPPTDLPGADYSARPWSLGAILEKMVTYQNPSKPSLSVRHYCEVILGSARIGPDPSHERGNPGESQGLLGPIDYL